MAAPDRGWVPRCVATNSGGYDHTASWLNGTGATESIDTTYGVFFLLIGTLAVAGNSCALYFFIKVDKRFTTSKIFYTSFAVLDLLTGFFCISTALTFIKGRYLLPCSDLNTATFFLDLTGAVNTFTFLGSSNIIAVMCLSRCISVLAPFSFKFIFTPVSCFIMVGVCCLHPFIMATLPFYKGLHYQVEMVTGLSEYSLTSITEENSVDSETGKRLFSVADALNIALSLVPRLVSLLVILVSSIIVAVMLLGSNMVSANKNSQKKAAITLIVLALIYFITYIPFAVIVIADAAGLTLGDDEWYFTTTPAFFVIAYSSSAMNPFVYHLRGRSMFEEKKQSTQSRRSTMYQNTANINNTRLSVVGDSGV